MEKKSILVIFGGHSMEYYAGCKAFGGAIENIDGELFNVIKIGITPDGEWLLTNASSAEIKDGDAWIKRDDNKIAFITPIRGDKTITVLDKNQYYKMDIDIVFPLIAGFGGEDGRLQGLLDLSDIPYVGSGLFASACAMDKEYTRIFADLCEFKQPNCIILKNKEFSENGICNIEKAELKYPLYVKPANGGTSIGVSRVNNSEELMHAVIESFKYDNKTIIEEEIKGTEIKVAILGNDEVEIGELCQIVLPEGTINDYETKQVSSSRKYIPALIDEKLAKEIKIQAKLIYKKLGCRGFARVDFFLTEDHEIYFNEINTIPGLGENSIYSLMFNKKGIGFQELLTKLIMTAIQ